MRKSFSALAALAFTLAMSAPMLSTTNADAATKAAPAKPAAPMTPGSDAMAKKHVKKHHMACKVTKKHKCRVKHKMTTHKKMMKPTQEAHVGIGLSVRQRRPAEKSQRA